eukprot:CAMPEP_0184331460 /NCGR_PEP_ID=MMETSP1089-20130417/790_1 /TAXON_ID=38269 ORGANISM="Gloeochaete wittrockiana, Strain SAG46.84" /NCGR_SAMPLE_ID=MMETSP1089 /ASSEMBLY_ACC=CAM_ASM_000445 /LENGTH=322 /DNA_ID=CAMNT_0026654389 /DNA_START=22 /DNA_END=990 /DNA_ORIENTATION=-
MRSFAIVLLGLCAVALAMRTTGDYTPLCGAVFDGAREGADLQVQGENDKIEAHWSGFENGMEKHRILRYEWAIVSSKQLKSSSLEENVCRSVAGFVGKPDVYGWANVERNTKVSASVPLTVGETYFVVLRATNSFGKLIFANSNGVTIEAQKSSLFARSTSEVKSASSSEERSDKRDIIHPRQALPFTSNGLVFDFNLNCPIDAANRCEQSKVKVGDYLTKIYGPADFTSPAEKPGTLAVAGGSSDVIFKVVPEVKEKVRTDKSPGNVDNHKLNTGAAIGLAIGVVCFFFVLFAFVVVAAGVVSRAKDGKFGTGGSDEADEH